MAHPESQRVIDQWQTPFSETVLRNSEGKLPAAKEVMV